MLDRALMHCDSVYNIPVVRAVGMICKTNQSSNTAFRGFGGPQVGGGASFPALAARQLVDTPASRSSLHWIAAQVAVLRLFLLLPCAYGWVQGMVVIEQIMERVARAVGRPVEEVQRLNMYKVGWGG